MNPETTGARLWYGVNRVSSKNNPAKFLAVFVVVAAATYLFAFGIGCAFASDIASQKIIDLANVDRKEKGLEILAENEKLTKAAMDKAEDMTKKNYFAHTSPEGTTPWHWIEKENYDYNYAGENLAMDFVSAEKMNQAWLASPTHRANIMNEKYKDIGVAAREGIAGGHATTIVVQMFGSGDKNATQEQTSVGAPQKEKISSPEGNTPDLPSGEKRTEKIVFEKPQITSPQKGEFFSSRKIEVSGRAKPKSKVTVFDSGIYCGDSIADENGWFKFEINNISEGNHNLTATTENSAAGKNEARVSGEVSFQVDRQKPSIGYHLYADNRTNNYLVRLSADENNCFYQLGMEKAPNGFDGAAVFAIKSNQTSIVATVSDRAGNKSRRQIALANYFAGNGGSNIIDDLALSFLSRTAYAADSGRRAIAGNLGIMTGGFNN